MMKNQSKDKRQQQFTRQESSDEDEASVETKFKLNVTKKKSDIDQTVIWTDADAAGRRGEHVWPKEEDSEMFLPPQVVPMGTQMGIIRGQNFSETEAIIKESEGMNHKEGGWSKKDAHIEDEQQKARFRKKTEKDENYLKQVQVLLNQMMGRVRQNNSLDIYEEYFLPEAGDDITYSEEGGMETLVVLTDPVTVKRAVADLSWKCHGMDNTLAVAYCGWHFQDMDVMTARHGYIFDCNDPRAPLMAIESIDHISCISFNPREVGTSY